MALTVAQGGPKIRSAPARVAAMIGPEKDDAEEIEFPGVKDVTTELVNERGNQICISACRGEMPGDVVVCIKGPTSETTNTLTFMEARALAKTLHTFLGG